jgi:hypothetical protein
MEIRTQSKIKIKNMKELIKLNKVRMEISKII